jgi:hypothetical protein
LLSALESTLSSNLGELSDILEEIKGMAEHSGLPFEVILLLHLVYETKSLCTSVVALEGVPWLARTLDWDCIALRQFTIDLRFVKNGRLLFRATSFAGYVGVFTACKPNAFGAAINFRPLPSLLRALSTRQLSESSDESKLRIALTDAVSALQQTPSALPIGLWMRIACETCSNFDSLLLSARSQPLAAPTFISLVGITATQGVVLARDPSSVVSERDFSHCSSQPPVPSSQPLKKRRRIAEAAPANFIVQANSDVGVRSEQDFFMSRQRCRAVTIRMQKHGDVAIAAKLWKALKPACVWDSQTIYGVVMCPSDDTYQARIATVV